MQEVTSQDKSFMPDISGYIREIFKTEFALDIVWMIAILTTHSFELIP